MARTKSEARHELEELANDAERVARRVREKLDELSAEDLEELGKVAAGEPDLSGMTSRAIKMPKQKPGRSKQDYATPVEFIRAVERRWGPLVHDLAAHSRNARCASYYSIEEGVDSLAQSWSTQFPHGNLWLNPEFAHIEPWAAKCADERPKRRGLIFLLTPASIGAEWFANHVEGKALVIGLRPRLSFDGINPYPKDCMLSVFGEDDKGFQLDGFETWRWDSES